MKYKIPGSFITLPLALFFTLAICAGCGDSSNSSQDDSTFIRVINSIEDASGIDVNINGEQYFSRLGFADNTGYFRVNASQQQLQISISDTFTSVLDRNTTFSDQQDQSVLVFGSSANSRSLIIKDENESPGSDLSKVRFINLSESPRGGVAVFIFAQSSTDRSDLPPAETSLSFGTVSEYLVSNAGNYTINITEPVKRIDDPTPQTILGRTQVTFDSEGVYSVIIAPRSRANGQLNVFALRDSR